MKCKQLLGAIVTLAATGNALGAETRSPALVRCVQDLPGERLLVVEILEQPGNKLFMTVIEGRRLVFKKHVSRERIGYDGTLFRSRPFKNANKASSRLELKVFGKGSKAVGGFSEVSGHPQIGRAYDMPCGQTRRGL